MEQGTEPTLTVDEAYRAAFHFINQYYERERITPFFLMLHSMTEWTPGAGKPRETADPATWSDWMESVERARQSSELPELNGPKDDKRPTVTSSWWRKRRQKQDGT